MDVDISVAEALEVFSLPADFDLDSLKKAYRTVALRVHPDRGGNASLFRTVKECFAVLCMEHNSRSGGALHDQLKLDFEADVRNYDSVGRRDVEFDINRFNSVFENTRTKDGILDSGYGDWFQSGQDLPSSKSYPKINPKSGSEAFNKAFEDNVPAPKNTETALVVRPVDITCGSTLWLTELGVDSVDDYSNGAAFDCRIAHTTQRLADNREPTHRHDHRAQTPEQIQAQRTADLARGLTHLEYELLRRDEEKNARLDAARRDIEMQKHKRFSEAHAQANRMLLGAP
jgi:curved DNA-binding protein CbpA